MKWACLLALLLPVSSFEAPSSPSSQYVRYSYTEYHMGVDARIVLYATSESKAVDAARKAFERIADLDSKLSDYRVDSELMKLCAIPADKPFKASKDLFKVLKRSQEISRLSNGAFDVTVGHLTQLWRKARKSSILPTDEEVRAALQKTGWQNIELIECGRLVRMALDGMKLDLGGIAKGYACDEAQTVLKHAGIRCALVEMGGDLVVSNAPPGTSGWTIQVLNADQNIQYSNCAISTSGDTMQAIVISGVHYSHVIDPRTGRALTNRVQATVVAKDGLTSDPVSTTVTLLSESERKQILRKYPKTNSYVKVLAD